MLRPAPLAPRYFSLIASRTPFARQARPGARSAHRRRILPRVFPPTRAERDRGDRHSDARRDTKAGPERTDDPPPESLPLRQRAELALARPDDARPVLLTSNGLSW